MLNFPDIDPIIFSLGPIAIRWYSLAYIAGFIIGLWGAKKIVSNGTFWAGNKQPFEPIKMDDALLWLALGGILGGRIFYMFVYNFQGLLANPLSLFKVWEGGMAFHGGIIGSCLGLVLYAKRENLPPLTLFDITSAFAPLGIFFGRIANFINGELWGRVTDFKYGMVFPHGGDQPRHMSQLYQAAMEGLILLIILQILVQKGGLKRQGLVTGVFLMGYGLFRFIGEFFREPDPQLGFLWGGATMGQLLSIPALILGVWFVKKSATH